MKNLKKFLAVFTAAAMMVSAAGCVAGSGNGDSDSKEETSGESTGTEDSADSGDSGSEGGDVTLTFWSWLPTTDQSEEMIAAFEEENPNIHIDYTRTEQDDFFEKLQVAMASGTGPDLFGMTTGPMMEQYAKFSADMKEVADEYWSGWDG